MISFIISIVVLILGYFTYGKFVEKIFGVLCLATLLLIDKMMNKVYSIFGENAQYMNKE